MQLPRGALLQQIEERTRSALASGALMPIETGVEFIEDEGVRFAIRVRQNVARKAALASVPRKNPFLAPYEEALYVGDLTDSHAVLLNKFNVFERHALFVTKAYEDQETLLHEQDFHALLLGLEEIDGLSFYNGGGKLSGASQPHKHLQLVPFPIVEGIPGTPMDERIRARRVPFPSAVSELPKSASEALRVYRAMLRDLGCERDGAPYNLLATREWMMVVPRTRECFEDISINSLGFVGSLFVKDAAQLERVRAAGPISMLRAVTT